MIGILIRKEKETQINTQRKDSHVKSHRGEGHVKMGAEIGVMHASISRGLLANTQRQERGVG